MKNITMSEEQISLYIPVLEASIKKQEAEIKEIERELKVRNKKLNEDRLLLNDIRGRPSSNISAIKADEYKTEWSLIQKVKFILEPELEPLSVRDIFERLKSVEPEIQGERSDQIFKTTIAASLGNYAKDGQTFYKAEDGTINKYGLLENRK